MGDYLRVTAFRDGFRRAGRAWSTTPTIVPRADLTDGQIEQLEADVGIDVVPCGPEGVGAAVPADVDVRALSVDEARRELIAAGVRDIDPADRNLWTSDGRPAVDALEGVTGLGVISAAERDAAWAARAKGGGGGGRTPAAPAA